MTWKSDLYYLEKAVNISEIALDKGNEPFGALLVDSDGKIVLEQPNQVGDLRDDTAHDSLELARQASRRHEKDYLSRCTIYATIEPCFMCFGAIFWAGIGNVKFAMLESDLNKMFGGEPLITIHTDTIVKHIARTINVNGPYAELTSQVKAVIQKWIETFPKNNW